MSEDFGKRLDEYLCHFWATDSADREHERSHFRAPQGIAFHVPVADSLVLCQDEPTFPPNFFEPILISCVWRKMVIMHFDPNSRLAQRGSNFLPTDRAIQEKDGDVSQFRTGIQTGSRLRFRSVDGRSPPPGKQWTPHS